MSPITEDYVSFETAKLIKEKGFEGECRDYYNTDGHFCSEDFKSNWNHGGSATITIFSAPTLQMAMKWLREVHDCPIEILWHWDADSQCSEWYFAHHMELKSLPQIQYYDTYEAACEAAIKYCLENVI